MNFTHLHVHTEYSLLDGSNKIKECITRVKELGMDSVAITDHGVMFGVIDFYRVAKAEGIRPILGCEVYVAPGSRFDKELGNQDDKYYHLVLLAENNTGYGNLMKIVSKGFTEGYYYKPRVDLEVLSEYHEGIIALSACLAGEVQKYLNRGFYEEGKKAALRYEQLFGAGNFFLELQDHGMPEQKRVNMELLRLSQETGIPLVATNDVHYTYAEDEKPHDILLCLQTGKKLSDENRMRYEGGQYYLKSPEEMRDLFPYALQALENTHEIAKRCNVEIEFGVTKLPKYDVPDGMTSWEYLNKLCFEGLQRCYPAYGKELEEQLNYELSIIKKMGYVDYFLIVWDFIKYAKDHGIAVGPGRGSAAGSIVSYTLGITTIDPIKYNLLFERFLNPERVSMPDIDVDFCFERRQEVIDYVVEKYGKDRVVQIVTFGTLAARGVIRDVGRVMDLPYQLCDQTAKQIPQELNITIDKALKVNPELKKNYEDSPEIHELIEMAKRLEGLPRHTSMHAAGVVISQKSVDEYVPLSRGSDGSVTTQFTMTTLEELGLLKMDFLGLRTLTVIQNAVKLIKKTKNIEIHIDHIDYNDPNVLALIGSGKCEGIFQLESAGMKNFMKELKPKSLEDIIAGISLYRPGPMDFIPQYIKGKDHPETIHYDCEELQSILEPTYGCIVYQEQVMQIVQKLAGYTLGRADLVRRAMSKKKASVMEQERKNFVYGNQAEGVPGCISRGISEKTANKIFDDMTDFAKYAFNKSHAAAYAVVSYQTAWLKCYYPVPFMAALLTSVIDNPSKVAEYILHCRQLGIEILPPDLNVGYSGFSVSEKGIHYGLSAIKSIGRSVIEAIVAERKQNGKYESLKDFISRLGSKEVNKRTIENFIKAGALDCLAGTRKQKMMVYVQMMEEAAREKKTSMTGQMTLFDFVDEEMKASLEIKLPNVGEFEQSEKLAFEKEVLGVYLSGHPLQECEERWRKAISHTSADFLLDEETGMTQAKDGERAIVGGIISAKSVKLTKNNKQMAYLTIEDLVGTVEVIVFPRDYENNAALLNEDAKVFVQGRVACEDDKPSRLICEKIIPFEQEKQELWIQFADMETFRKQEVRMFNTLKPYEGDVPVVVYLAKEKQWKQYPKNRNISLSDSLVRTLKEQFGEHNIKIRTLKAL